jgi:hypothetical protein
LVCQLLLQCADLVLQLQDDTCMEIVIGSVY